VEETEVLVSFLQCARTRWLLFFHRCEEAEVLVSFAARSCCFSLGYEEEQREVEPMRSGPTGRRSEFETFEFR
jgi:hypothetical protein